MKAVLPFLCGLALGWQYYSRLPAGLILFLALVMIVFLLTKAGTKGFVHQTGIYTLILLAGYLFGHADQVNYYQKPLFTAAEQYPDLRFSAVISDVIRSDDKSSFAHADLEWCRIEDKTYRNPGKVWLKLDGPSPVTCGRRIIGAGKLEPLPPPRNPGDFDFRTYSRRIGISALLKCPENDWRSSGFGGSQTYKRIILPVRNSIAGKIDEHIGGEEGEIVKAMVLGTRAGLTGEVKLNLRYSGLWHLLSLSGLHLGIVAGLLALTASLLNLPVRYRGLFIIAAVWTFTLIAETRTPLIRAALIITLLIGAKYLSRYFDRWNLLAFSALIIVIFRPAELFSAGFQLSYLAVIFILAGFESFGQIAVKSKPVKRNLILRWLLSAFIASFLATLGTAPLLAYHFGGLPLMSIIGSVAGIPLITVILGLFPVLYFGSLISGLWGGIMGNSIWALANLFEKLLSLCGNQAYYLHTPDFHFWYLIPVLLPALLLILKKRSCIWVSLISLNLLIWGMALDSKTVKCYFLDVGQGSAALLDVEDGDKILIDAGPAFKDFNAGRDVIADFLCWRGIKEIDYLILSHDDQDHTGGAPYLLDNYKINNVVVNSVFPAIRTNSATTICSAGDWFQLQGGLLTFFNPAISEGDDNESSLVVKYSGYDKSILFTGDIPAAVEKSLAGFGSLIESDLMTAAHHGSKYSNSAAFIHQVSPRWAVISCGKNNHYGHPPAETLIRFGDANTKIHRTDTMGAGVFEISKDGIKKINWRSY